MEIVPFGQKHVAAVLQLEQECFPDAYPASFLEGLTRDGSAKCVVVLLDGQVSGYALAYATDVYDLLRICVATDVRQKGLGSEMLKSFADRPVALEVSVQNQGALAFYKKNGFSLAHVRTDYYGAGADGLVCIRPKL